MDRPNQSLETEVFAVDLWTHMDNISIVLLLLPGRVLCQDSLLQVRIPSCRRSGMQLRPGMDATVMVMTPVTPETVLPPQ